MAELLEPEEPEQWAVGPYQLFQVQTLCVDQPIAPEVQTFGRILQGLEHLEQRGGHVPGRLAVIEYH